MRSLALVLALVAVNAQASTPKSPATAAQAPAQPHSVLTGEPGYVPPVDPDSNAVKTGRRKVAPTMVKFHGGARSLDALARDVLVSIAKLGPDGPRPRMDSLFVSHDEFAKILWPEFPQSRPVTGVTADDAWYFLVRRNLGGKDRLIGDRGGDGLTFVRVERGMPVETYTNFKLHRGLTIVARDPEGNLVRLDDVRTVAERGGRFKIYSMRD